MKLCPKCKTEHNKNGVYCSRACANTRVWTDSDKQKKSASAKQFYSTERGAARIQKLSEYGILQTQTEAANAKRIESCKKSWTDERRKKQANICSTKVWSTDARKKLSLAAKCRNLGGHTSKRKLFFQKKNGEVIYLQSSYEIQFAELLEELNIDWERPDPIGWIDDMGVSHKYYADFRIGDIYLDTKNDYLANKDSSKIAAVKQQNNIDLRIVLKEQLNKEYIASLV